MYMEKQAELWKTFSPGKYFKLKNRFYVVKNADILKYVYSKSLGGSETTSDTAMTNLEPSTGVIYIFLIGIAGPVAVHVKQPATVDKWGVKRYPEGWLTAFDSPYMYPSPDTVSITLKEYTISMRLKNLISSSATAKILFKGHRYEVEEVRDSERLALVRKLYTLGKIPEITISGLKEE